MKQLFSDCAVIVDAHSEYPLGYVAVDGDTIVEVGEGRPRPELVLWADHHERMPGMTIMPGFVSAHTHLFQSLLRGISTDQNLEGWLSHDIWPNVERFSPRDFRLAATSGLLENLRSGVTSVLENHYVHTDPINIDNVCQAFADTGMRGLIARGGVDRDGQSSEEQANRYTEDRSVYRREFERFFDAWHGAAQGRIRTECAIQTTWLASPQLCEEVAAIARDHEVGVHAHCAETRTSVRDTQRVYGMREVHFFDRAGLLNDRTQLVHCVWLDESERERLADTGTVVVSCPTSNAYLASGIADVPDYRRRGMPVALGADGPGSNNGQNMFETVKWAALLQRAKTCDATVLGEEDVLDMVWAGGARALGLEEHVGALRAGCLADIVALDTARPPYHGTANMRRAVVFSGSPDDVRHVWVNGRQVLHDGEPTLFDARGLDTEVETRMRQLNLRKTKEHDDE